VFVSTCLHSINTSGEQCGQVAAQDNRDKQILLAESLSHYLYLKCCKALLLLVNFCYYFWLRNGRCGV